MPGTDPAKKLVLIVIDGLTPAMLEQTVERRTTPALAFLADHATYGRAVSVFPSLTPVCLSSISTGAYPDVHEIPHLVWYDRREERLVEYGSSFGAVSAAGIRRVLRDTIFTINQQHLAAGATTVYESVEDAGLVPAAINITCYRGRTRHLPSIPGVPAAYGPRRFFYYNLFESDSTGAPLSVRNRPAGSIDAYAAAVGRWLVTRDGFDFLAFYLSDYDYASHGLGPGEAHEALARTDSAIGALLDAAGGPDEFLERYAVVVCADHGQTKVTTPFRLEDPFAAVELALVTASNRAGMVYRLPGCALEARELALLLDGEPAAEAVLFLEGDEAVVRREGEECRFAPDGEGWRTSGDASLLDYPNGMERAWHALRNPNAGEVLVSPADGYEFTDLAGRHHGGGGSHGSLTVGDSEVPMLAVGLDELPGRIVDVAPAALRHLGIEPPPYARSLSRAT